MISRKWQQRSALCLLIIYSGDLALKLADWRESFGILPWWGIALGLGFRFALMGGIFYLYLKLKNAPGEQPPVTKPMQAAAMRYMRILHTVLCIAIVMYAYVAQSILRPTSVAPPLFVETFSVLCVITVVIGFVFRRRLLPPAVEGLRRGDPTSLARWQQANVLSMVLGVSVSMYGVALRAIGGSLQVAWAFFIAAGILMWVWRPQFIGTSSTQID